LRIEGYVIVSANGCLADANGVMPPSLKFDSDQAFFNSSLDDVDLIVHGGNSYEDQPNSPGRKRIILTRKVATIASDPANPNATLWNPDGVSFEEACVKAGVRDGTAAIIGGPKVFAMFLNRYDTFWLSEAHRVTIPDGLGAFPGAPEKSPDAILADAGLRKAKTRVLDETAGVTVTAWRRPA
jgi:hypothetical protein